MYYGGFWEIVNFLIQITMSNNVLDGIQENARTIHNALRNYYQAWEELEAMANDRGYTLDTKTAELKKL
jgi:hypothetical protein